MIQTLGSFGVTIVSDILDPWAYEGIAVHGRTVQRHVPLCPSSHLTDDHRTSVPLVFLTDTQGYSQSPLGQTLGTNVPLRMLQHQEMDVRSSSSFTAELLGKSFSSLVYPTLLCSLIRVTDHTNKQLWPERQAEHTGW